MTLRRALPTALPLLLLAGCHRVQAPASLIRMGDPAIANQLLSGLYDVEGQGENEWRWSGSEFSVALGTPAAPQDGARLRVRLYFPETQVQKLGPITLTAFVDGEPLAPETYAAGGSYDFVRDVPACFLHTSELPVRFSFDPYEAKSSADGRDLGAVVSMVELEAKR